MSKNLRDFLVRASMPHRFGGLLADSNHLTTPRAPATPVATLTTIGGPTKQTSITDFLVPAYVLEQEASSSGSDTRVTRTKESTPIGLPIQKPKTNMSKGFSFCNMRDCRYCPLLNKTSNIHYKFTGENFTCMKKVSCKSSNLIYAITCTRCWKWNVGQTFIRLKECLYTTSETLNWLMLRKV